MTEKIIKHRLFTWFEEMDSPTEPGQLRERVNTLGQKVDITRVADVARGEALGSFYTDEEAQQIEDGTYRGLDAEALYAAREGLGLSTGAVGPMQPADGETGSVPDAATLAQQIQDQNMKVADVLAMVPEDADSETIQRFIDAENIATDNEPRSSLIDALEKRQAALDEGD